VTRPALAVFLACFLGTILLGSTARRWGRHGRPAPEQESIEDWGLGGRQFGTWVTWFLVGGDFYTAYTVIAVPALVYATGAYGFFALPYTIIVYPFVFAVMPRLWLAARDGGHVTAADLVRARTGSRLLECAVALTGLVAVLPYIGLQLVGIRTVLESLGLPGQMPLIAAFAALAIYTWMGGLHAPALTAFIKDVMIYVVVLVAVTLIPLRLGGYGAVFAAAAPHLPPHPPGRLLGQGQGLPYATLALSSALAAFLYPHTLTGVLAARSADTIRRNAVMLPAYTLLLGLIALLGLMAHAAGIHAAHANAVVPLLFLSLFPGWFAGFAFAAIAVGALVPASVMAIGAANLASRNIVRVRGDAQTAARIMALLVKLGALGCVLLLSPQFAIDLQLLGGVWVLQTFPAVILCALPDRSRSGRLAPALLCGWLAGIVLGTALVTLDGLRPVHGLAFAGLHLSISTALIALVANLAVCGLVAWALAPRSRGG
jgi:solute:Na+ symporter, SSS family